VAFCLVEEISGGAGVVQGDVHFRDWVVDVISGWFGVGFRGLDGYDGVCVGFFCFVWLVDCILI